MLDPPKPASLRLSVATAIALLLCIAIVVIASCGTPAQRTHQDISPSPPAGSPADVIPAPTTAASPPVAGAQSTTAGQTPPAGVAPSPAADASATVPGLDGPAGFSGRWAGDQGLVLELGGDGAYSLSRGSRQPETGTWSIQQDGSLRLEGQSYVLVPHGNLLLLDGGDAPFILGVLQRLTAGGTPLAYEPASTIDVPPIVASTASTITIADDWTGLSPVAPIEAHFRLAPAAGAYLGTAEFSVAGYTGAITRTVPISVPLAVVEEFLALLQSTPLEEGVYKRVFNHTDDFPSIAIAVEGSSGDLTFASESQGSRHIPWRVGVGPDAYMTYADTPQQALDLLDPYLARDVQEALFDLALNRDP